MNTGYLTTMLEHDEGRRNQVYKDTLGNLTTGVGRNLAKPFSPAEIDLMLTNDIADALTTCKRLFPNFDTLDAARQVVVMNMAFNMGFSGLSTFVNTIDCINRGNYLQAATNMLASKWAKQVGKRANRLAAIMESGNLIFPINW